MTSGFQLDIKADLDTEDFFRMLRQGQLDARRKAVMRYITHTATKTVLDTVQSKIPSGPSYNTYRRSLKLVQFPTTDPVFAIIAESKAEPVDSSRDVLYIRERNTGRRTPPEVKLLLQYQPWTADTLPLPPPTKFVEVIKRRVSEREVELVRKNVESKRREWTAAFTKAGVRLPQGPVADSKAVPDIAYTAIRLEYGLGGSRAVAHWRPALASVRQQVTKIFSDEEVGRALLDWSFSGWKRWRTLSEEFVPATVIESFDQFQDKLR